MKKSVKGMMAVVTGASSGIGLSFCRELAARGCGLVMVSNQEEELVRHAREITSRFGVDASTLCLDLTAVDADMRIRAFLDEKGLDPDILINNAGVFSFAPVTDIPERKTNIFIDLHVRAVTLLSRMFAERFRRRGSGYILNMSSMSCWMPMPGIALYSATKAYIRVFSRALNYEMRDYGVGVTVACPGGIATDLFGLPENLKKLAVAIGAITTPERFTRKAVDRMLARKPQYINGWLNRLSIFLIGVAPAPVRMLVKRKMLDKGITRP